LRRCPFIALIVVMLLGSTAWPDLCARRSNAHDCCKAGACQMRMQAGTCQDHHETKSVVTHFERAIAIDPVTMPLPPASLASHGALRQVDLLAGVDRTPDRPPRLDSPSR
jgi:hypothetical protein